MHGLFISDEDTCRIEHVLCVYQRLDRSVYTRNLCLECCASARNSLCVPATCVGMCLYSGLAVNVWDVAKSLTAVLDADQSSVVLCFTSWMFLNMFGVIGEVVLSLWLKQAFIALKLCRVLRSTSLRLLLRHWHAMSEDGVKAYLISGEQVCLPGLANPFGRLPAGWSVRQVLESGPWVVVLKEPREGEQPRAGEHWKHLQDVSWRPSKLVLHKPGGADCPDLKVDEQVLEGCEFITLICQEVHPTDVEVPLAELSGLEALLWLIFWVTFPS